MKKINEQQVYDAHIFSVSKVILHNAEEKEVIHSVVRFVDTVSVLPITPEGNIILEKQYRTPINDYLLEIPAGKIDQGESPETALQRELEEEIGYRTKELRKCFEAYVSCGISDEKMYYYIATVEKIPENERTVFPDDNEHIEIVEVTVDQAVNMIYNYEIKDTKSIMMILAYINEKIK